MQTLTYRYFWIFLLLLSACGPRIDRENIIQIKGSDTEVNLALSLTERFMELDSTISLSVTGGGSGTGIASLINNRTQIANSSREMREEEIFLAEQRGVKPFATIFAVDGLAIISHPTQTVDSLSLSQIAAIFTGRIQDWQEVGGKAGPISMYGRQSNSGTYVYFRDYLLKADYTPEVKRMNGSAQIVEAVKNDPSSIGYVGIGYITDKKGELTEGLKVIHVSRENEGKSYSPLNVSSVISGLYPITRPLYQYTNGKPEGKVRDFILFELSEEGQQIIRTQGYYPITASHIAINRKNGLYDQLSD